MTELHTETLPLLPLTTGVVLPGMVVTLTIESDDAAAAIEAAAQGEVLLVPKIEGRYARVGTVAKVEEVGRVRGGAEAVVIRGLHRGVVGVGVPGTGSATWVQIEPIDDGRGEPPRAGARARVPGDPGDRSSSRVACRRSRSSCAGSTTPGRSPTWPATPPTSASSGRSRSSRRSTSSSAWRRSSPGRRTRSPRSRSRSGSATRSVENLEKRQRELILREQMAAIRKELGEDDGDDAVARAPREDRGGRHARRGARAGRARARPARAHLGPVARVRVDPDVPGLADRGAVGRPHRRQPRHRRGARRARRRPRRPRGREGPDPRVPGRAEAPARARPRRGDRPRLGRDPHARRPPRRRQDLARRVGRARARPHVRPRLARRHPRRGRDPRAPAHLRRRAARAGSSAR